MTGEILVCLQMSPGKVVERCGDGAGVDSGFVDSSSSITDCFSYRACKDHYRLDWLDHEFARDSIANNSSMRSARTLQLGVSSAHYEYVCV